VNRFVGVVAAVGVVLMASALPAAAQNISFGYQYQHLSGVNQGVNMPAGLNVDVGIPVGSGVSLVGQFDWSSKSASEVVFGTSVSGNIDVSTFGGGVRWTAAMSKLAPFVDVLFGGSHFSGSVNLAGIQVTSGSTTDPMLQVGGGVAVPMGSAVSVLGQFDYRRMFTDPQGIDSFRFVGGIRVGFGH
jgi:outer membrane protein with beta-barrel domain